MAVRIAMIGTGYVGLVTGACFAELGHDVTCVDADPGRIARIQRGEMPFYEPDLEALVARNVAAGRLRFSTDTAASVRGREAVFIAVGTPSEGDTGRADLRHVFAAAGEVAAAIDTFTVVVTKSTVPVGTNRRVADRLREVLGDSARFAVASNPEFLREGAAIRDFMEPDRVIVGAEDDRAFAVMARVYAPMAASLRLLRTNIETAEVVKYAANGFLAVKVGFINEIADLCEATGADVRQVAAGLGLDHRIGAAFLRTGPGWGGSCLPKDTRALAATAEDAGVASRIVSAAIAANSARKAAMVERIRRAAGGTLAGRRIGVLGVTFKGQTDDMRESPSLDILPPLVAEGAELVAYDPGEPPEAPRLLPGVTLVASAAAAATDAELLVVLTDWQSFAALDLGALARAMRTPHMLDLRNLFDGQDVLAAGFARYEGLGATPLEAGPAA